MPKAGAKTAAVPPDRSADKHPTTRSHVRRCRRCRRLLGEIFARFPVGELLASYEVLGRERIAVYRAGGLCWVVEGSEVTEVTADEQQALEVADRLQARSLAPEPPRLEVRRSEGGIFRLLEDGHEIDRGRDPRQLVAEAFRLAEQWMPEIDEL